MRAFLCLLTVSVSWLGAGCGRPTCATNDDCVDGQVCIDDGQKERVCAKSCAADLRCAGGEACILRDDGSQEGACLAVTGHAGVGGECKDDRDCASGACFGPTGSGGICAATCDSTIPCSDDSLRCVLDGLHHVCAAPTDDVATGDDCLEPSDCLSGTCVIPPESDQPICADNCDTDDDCHGDDVACLRLVEGARACLAQLHDGTECDAKGECFGGFCIKDVDDVKKCASACDDGGACNEGFSCETDLDDNDVCMPVLDTRADGEDCAQARECASGHCAHFATPDEELGTLCASPCDDAGQCGAPLVCWQDPGGTDVCGPSP
jgi:hypothetical protein